MWRWLAADPRDVVDLAGAGALGDGNDEPRLGEELRRWRRIVGRRRLVALVRRHAAVALALAVVLEILAQVGAFAQWVVVAVPLVALLVSVSTFAARGPSPFGLARLLDDKLGLNDRLATALEIEARDGGAGLALEKRTVADATALLRAGREDWRAAAAPAGNDWWALATPVAALSVVVAIGTAGGGGSASGRTEALGPGSGGGPGNAPNERHRKRDKKGKKPLAPTGKLHRFKGVRRPPTEASTVEASKEGYRQIPQGGKTGKEAKGAGSKGAGKKGANKTPTGYIHEGSGDPKRNPGLKEGSEKSAAAGAKKEKEHPTVGFNVKGEKKGNGTRQGTSEVSGAGNKKPSPNGQQGETSASTSPGSNQQSGTPTGAGKAGGEKGTNQQGHATPIQSQASQAVKIQPGYAPSRSSEGGKEHNKAGNEQGAGGKARTAQVTGATQVGDQFSFVPAAGGAVPGPSAGLQQNYLESLKWVQRLPW